MKKIAVIGASYLQKPLVLKAHEMGLSVICFAWEEGSVCKNIADKYYPISIVEKDKILTICNQEKIDGICTIASDVAAPTVAYVASKMGLVGNDYSSALLAYNKAMMRDKFVKLDIPCPWFQHISSFDDLSIDKLNFPLIVKPVDRSGSLGVTKVDSIENLKSAIEVALSFSFSKQVMVEQFVEGHEISVEFISFNGCHYPITITDKITTGSAHFVELEHHQPSVLSPDLYNEIYKLTNKALDALSITNGASHTEYKIDSNGRLYIMELGARMGGDFIGSDLVPLSTGYDYVKGVIDVALNNFSVPEKNLMKSSGVYFICQETSRLCNVMSNLNLYPSIVRAELQSTHLNSVTCSSDRNGYLIYQANQKLSL